MNSQGVSAANLDQIVDTYEKDHGQEFPKAGCAYTGNPWNFYLDFGDYKTDLEKLSTKQKIELKLEQLKEDKDALPWE
jgi:hypothetical protein